MIGEIAFWFGLSLIVLAAFQKTLLNRGMLIIFGLFIILQAVNYAIHSPVKTQDLPKKTVYVFLLK